MKQKYTPQFYFLFSCLLLLFPVIKSLAWTTVPVTVDPTGYSLAVEVGAEQTYHVANMTRLLPNGSIVHSFHLYSLVRSPLHEGQVLFVKILSSDGYKHSYEVFTLEDENETVLYTYSYASGYFVAPPVYNFLSTTNLEWLLTAPKGKVDYYELSDSNSSVLFSKTGYLSSGETIHENWTFELQTGWLTDFSGIRRNSSHILYWYSINIQTRPGLIVFSFPFPFIGLCLIVVLFRRKRVSTPTHSLY